jgi:hypothetical protein
LSVERLMMNVQFSTSIFSFNLTLM